MILEKTGREYYNLAITTLPAVTDWEASFDGGTTWLDGTAGIAGDGTAVVQWLLAGPDADQGAAVAVLATGVTRPLIRGTESPELIVRDAPKIVVDN